MKFETKEQAEKFVSEKLSKVHFEEALLKNDLQEVETMRNVISFFQPIIESREDEIIKTKYLINKVKEQWGL